MSKNERLKQVNIDKIALFLNNKYNKVFKDKNFTMNALKYEISRLLVGKNMKLFNFNESIKKIEKSILKTVSNYGEIKYEPVQMDKINNLLSYNNNTKLQENTLFNNQRELPVNNKIKEYAPKLEEERKNQDYLKQPRIQSAIPKANKLNLNNNNNNNKKNANEIPYPTEKMEKLREREKNKWAIQANKEYEEYLKEQDKIKRDNYEKKMKQRKILEEQIKEKKEYEQKIKQEEKNVQPYVTSLNFEENVFNPNNKMNNNIVKEKENIKRPLSSKPMIKRRKEEIEYQKKIEEDLKKYEEQEKIKKKNLRDKYKEIQKENYENALKKKKERMKEKEDEKNEKNNENIFSQEDSRTKDLIKKKQKEVEELSKNKINQNIKHQMAINNYENQKYKREIEQEKKKFINEELAQNEKKKKMMNEFKQGLDEQIKEKQKLKELKNKAKINENKDNLNINNQIFEENNIRNKIRYEKINNYKKELDEQIERKRKMKQND